MSRSEAMLDAIGAIYDAGTDRERWPDALAATGRLIEAPLGGLMVYSRAEMLIEIIVGADPSYLGKMAEMMEHNLWYQRRHRAPLNRAVVGEQLASADEVRRSPVYSEIFKPNGVFHMCGLSLLSQSDLFVAANWMRSERKEPFGRAEVDLIDAVGPHIARAGRIAGLLQGVNLYKEALEASADRLAFGLLLDRRGRVLFANAEADRLLAAGRIRCRPDGRLAGSSVAADRSLGEFLRRLACVRQAVAVILPDANGVALKLVGAPLPSRRRDFACLAAVAETMVLVFDEAASPPDSARLIAELYGLTPAECRLAAALLAGQTLADYAENTRLTRNTVKTQLRSVFAKTETARQSDLMRKLVKLSAVLANV